MYNFLLARILACVAGRIVVPGVAPAAKIPQHSPADPASYAGYRNRHFYQYGGHIEFIRFKEYYGMPRGHSLSI